MKNETAISAQDAVDHPEDVELFCLEFDHRVQTSIRPAIKAELDRRQRVFDATLKCLAKPVETQNRDERIPARNRARPKGKQRRRRKRSRHSPGKARPPFVRDLASRLAKHWRVPLVLDTRLRPAS